MLVLRRGESWSSRGKATRSKEENNNKLNNMSRPRVPDGTRCNFELSICQFVWNLYNLKILERSTNWRHKIMPTSYMRIDLPPLKLLEFFFLFMLRVQLISYNKQCTEKQFICLIKLVLYRGTNQLHCPYFYRPFLSCLKLYYESKAKCKVFIMEISFDSYANKTNFHYEKLCT